MRAGRKIKDSRIKNYELPASLDLDRSHYLPDLLA